MPSHFDRRARKVLIEDRNHAAKAVGPYRVIHKFPVFRIRKCFFRTQLASPEVLTVVSGIVKQNAIDIPLVVAVLLRAAVV
jgi:hypothetical protein